MAIASTNLIDVVIKASDQASGVIREAQKSIANLEISTTKAQKAFDTFSQSITRTSERAIAGLKNAGDSATQSIQRLSTSLPTVSFDKLNQQIQLTTQRLKTTGVELKQQVNVQFGELGKAVQIAQSRIQQFKTNVSGFDFRQFGDRIRESTSQAKLAFADLSVSLSSSRSQLEDFARSGVDRLRDRLQLLSKQLKISFSAFQGNLTTRFESQIQLLNQRFTDLGVVVNRFSQQSVSRFGKELNLLNSQVGNLNGSLEKLGTQFSSRLSEITTRLTAFRSEIVGRFASITQNLGQITQFQIPIAIPDEVFTRYREQIRELGVRASQAFDKSLTKLDAFAGGVSYLAKEELKNLNSRLTRFGDLSTQQFDRLNLQLQQFRQGLQSPLPQGFLQQIEAKAIAAQSRVQKLSASLLNTAQTNLLSTGNQVNSQVSSRLSQISGGAQSALPGVSQQASVAATQATTAFEGVAKSLNKVNLNAIASRAKFIGMGAAAVGAGALAFTQMSNLQSAVQLVGGVASQPLVKGVFTSIIDGAIEATKETQDLTDVLSVLGGTAGKIGGSLGKGLFEGTPFGKGATALRKALGFTTLEERATTAVRGAFGKIGSKLTDTFSDPQKGFLKAIAESRVGDILSDNIRSAIVKRIPGAFTGAIGKAFTGQEVNPVVGRLLQSVGPILARGNIFKNVENALIDSLIRGFNFFDGKVDSLLGRIFSGSRAQGSNSPVATLLRNTLQPAIQGSFKDIGSSAFKGVGDIIKNVAFPDPKNIIRAREQSLALAIRELEVATQLAKQRGREATQVQDRIRLGENLVERLNQVMHGTQDTDIAYSALKNLIQIEDQLPILRALQQEANQEFVNSLTQRDKALQAAQTRLRSLRQSQSDLSGMNLQGRLELFLKQALTGGISETAIRGVAGQLAARIGNNLLEGIISTVDRRAPGIVQELAAEFQRSQPKGGIFDFLFKDLKDLGKKDLGQLTGEGIKNIANKLKDLAKLPSKEIGERLNTGLLSSLRFVAQTAFPERFGQFLEANSLFARMTQILITKLVEVIRNSFTKVRDFIQSAGNFLEPLVTKFQQLDGLLGGFLSDAGARLGSKLIFGIIKGLTAQTIGQAVNPIKTQIFQLVNEANRAALTIAARFQQVPQQIAAASSTAAKPFLLLGGLQETKQVFEEFSGFFSKFAQGVSLASQQIFFFTSSFQSIFSLIQNGPYQLLIGQNIQLQQQLLETQASLAATNQVIQNTNGVEIEIEDPRQKILALSAPVQAAIAQIRQDSLELVGVTSSQLIETFNIIATQSSSVGINMKESADLTIDFAAALGTIGLPLAQARQEISSIFTGTIDMNSVLAKTLGITNDQVKNWIRQGKVMEELQLRLKAFREGNALAAQTIGGVSSNIQELFELAFLNAGKPLLQPIVDELNSVFQFLDKNQKFLNDYISSITENLLITFQQIVRIGRVVGSVAGDIFLDIPQFLFRELAAGSKTFADAIERLFTALKPAFSLLGELADFVLPNLGKWPVVLAVNFLLFSNVINGLTKAFQLMTYILPGVGEGVFFFYKVLNSGLVNQVTFLTKQIGVLSGTQGLKGLSAALLLVAGQNLQSIPGAMGLISQKLGILGGVITPLIPKLSGFAIALVSLSEKYAFIAPTIQRSTWLFAVGLRSLSGVARAKGFGDLADQLLGYSRSARGAARSNEFLAIANNFLTETAEEAGKAIKAQILTIGGWAIAIVGAVIALNEILKRNKDYGDSIRSLSRDINESANLINSTWNKSLKDANTEMFDVIDTWDEYFESKNWAPPMDWVDGILLQTRKLEAGYLEIKNFGDIIQNLIGFLAIIGRFLIQLTESFLTASFQITRVLTAPFRIAKKNIEGLLKAIGQSFLDLQEIIRNPLRSNEILKQNEQMWKDVAKSFINLIPDVGRVGKNALQDTGEMMSETWGYTIADIPTKTEKMLADIERAVAEGRIDQAVATQLTEIEKLTEGNLTPNAIFTAELKPVTDAIANLKDGTGTVEELQNAITSLPDAIPQNQRSALLSLLDRQFPDGTVKSVEDLDVALQSLGSAVDIANAESSNLRLNVIREQNDDFIQAIDAQINKLKENGQGYSDTANNLRSLKSQLEAGRDAINQFGESVSTNETPLSKLQRLLQVAQTEIEKVTEAAKGQEQVITANLTEQLEKQAISQQEFERQKRETTKETLRQQLAETDKQLGEIEGLYNSLSEDDKGRAGEQLRGIIKLRGQQADLRRQIAESDIQDRQTRQKARVADFDEEIAEIERQRAERITGETEYRQKLLKAQLSKNDEELRQQREALSKLSKDDKEGREAIIAQIDGLLKQRNETIQKYNEEERKLALENFDEQKAAIERRFAQGETSREQFNREIRDNELGKNKEAIAQQRQLLSQLASNDKEGRERINAEIDKLLKEQNEIQQRYQESQITALEKKQKKALDVLKLAETDRLIGLQRLANEGLAFQAQIDLQRAESAKKSAKVELDSQREMLQELERLLPQTTGRARKDLESKILQSRIAVKDATLKLLQEEEQAYKAYIANIKFELDRQNQRYQNQLDEQNQSIKQQSELYGLLEKALDQRNELLRAGQELQKSNLDFISSELDALSKVEISEYRRRQLARGIAAIKLEAARQEIEIAKQSLDIEQQKQKLALEREKIQNRIAISDQQAAIAKLDADLQVARLDRQTTPEQLRAIELQREAAILQLNARFGEATLLEQQGQAQQRLFDLQRKQQEFQGRQTLRQAQVELIETARPGQRGGLKRNLQSQIIGDLNELLGTKIGDFRELRNVLEATNQQAIASAFPGARPGGRFGQLSSFAPGLEDIGEVASPAQLQRAIASEQRRMNQAFPVGLNSSLFQGVPAGTQALQLPQSIVKFDQANQLFSQGVDKLLSAFNSGKLGGQTVSPVFNLTVNAETRNAGQAIARRVQPDLEKVVKYAQEISKSKR